ncbi:hypothetical protein [Ottowia sp.]|uniref:hypothetical protein n=1 Tax=Ottowia sp. TaxID=1898956 RepID=UPI002C1C20BF|nr:hypothetical protein [Ottowia sp.]HRN76378.1 hypothetical protein [Ottowia sp.]HRQ02352.1 hypothetical protein [Ottowia sp.]
MSLNRPLHSRLTHLLLAAAIAALGAGNALAEKPEWAGGGKGNQQRAAQSGQKQQADERRGPRADRQRTEQRQLRGDERGPRAQRERDRREARGDRRAPVVSITPGSYFNDGQRRYVHQWYGEQYRAGRCPPGLAKKNNGCLPPGQAKKWSVGHVLPAGVVYYPVPQSVVVQLGVPPAGYQYVRVANDILLLAIGSRMVVDAITDLGRMF